MKRLIPLLALLAALNAHAQAIVQHAKVQATGSTAPAVTLSSVAAGDTLIIIPEYASGSTSPTVSSAVDSAGDTVHTDQALSCVKPASAYVCYGFYSVLATPNAGTHTITVTFNNTGNKELYVFEVSGLGSSVSFQTAATFKDGTGTSATSNAVTPSKNGALAVSAVVASASGISFSSWLNSFIQTDGTTTLPSGAWAYLASPTNGTALSTGVTLSASQDWAMGEAIYIPGSVASCTHTGFTSAGAQSIPNGTSGDYWLKNGPFSTPDCSTVQYWEPALGNFGAN